MAYKNFTCASVCPIQALIIYEDDTLTTIKIPLLMKEFSRPSKEKTKQRSLFGLAFRWEKVSFFLLGIRES